MTDEQQKVEQEFERFWKNIIINKDGTLNVSQIKKELYDYSVLLREVPKVYDALTGGKISKANTKAEAVIEVAREHMLEEIKESIAMQEIKINKKEIL